MDYQKIAEIENNKLPQSQKLNEISLNVFANTLRLLRKFEDQIPSFCEQLLKDDEIRKLVVEMSQYKHENESQKILEKFAIRAISILKVDDLYDLKKLINDENRLQMQKELIEQHEKFCTIFSDSDLMKTIFKENMLNLKIDVSTQNANKMIDHFHSYTQDLLSVQNSKKDTKLVLAIMSCLWLELNSKEGAFKALDLNQKDQFKSDQMISIISPDNLQFHMSTILHFENEDSVQETPNNKIKHL